MSHEPVPEVSIEELIRRARAGDEDAREQLFERGRRALDKWASQDLSQKHPALPRPSDLVQDTSLHAFSGFSRFKGSTEAEWFAWLKRIFRNQTVQSIRASQRKKRGPPGGTVPLDSPEAMRATARQGSPSHAASVQDEWRLMLAHLFQLPDDQRDAIWLYYLKDLSIAEAAQRMGRSEASVVGLHTRGFEALEARMKESLGTETGYPPGISAATNDAAAALLEYLRRRDAGEKVEPAAFIAGYPGCADELRSMLHWVERLQALRPAAPQP
jgi:RNA polymerase sigma-70 factor (ECF subfamily)